MKKAITITLVCLTVITSVCIPAFANVVTSSEDVVYPVINPNKVEMSFDWDDDQETDDEVTFYFNNEIINQRIGQRESHTFRPDNEQAWYYSLTDVQSLVDSTHFVQVSQGTAPYRIYFPESRTSLYDVIYLNIGNGDYIVEYADGEYEEFPNNEDRLYIIPQNFEELMFDDDNGHLKEYHEYKHEVTVTRKVDVWDGNAQIVFVFEGIGLSYKTSVADIIADNVIIGLNDNSWAYTSEYYARAYAYIYGMNEQEYLKYDLVSVNPDFRNGASYKYEFDSQYDAYYQTFGKNNVVVWWSEQKRDLGIIPNLSDTQTIVYVDETGYERDYNQQFLYRITGYANPNYLAYIVPDHMENTFVYEFIPVEYVERSPTLAITSGLPWGWITNELESFSLTGFLDGVSSFFFTDLFGYFSIADIIGIVVGIALLFAFLKLFVGG